jgi:GR25 family glycosyltransferase involved in LPS biosynthesis
MKKIELFLINETSQENRLNVVYNELNKIQKFVNVNRIVACSKEEAKQKMFSTIEYKAYLNIKDGPFRTDILPTWAAVACALSHKKCWEKLINDNLDYAIICEDDILINNPDLLLFKIFQAKKIMVNSLADTPTILDNIIPIKTSVLINFNSRVTYSYPVRTNLHRIKSKYNGSHFYILNKYAAIYLQSRIWPILHQIDIEIGLLYNDLYLYNMDNCGIKTNPSIPSTVQICDYDSLNIVFHLLPKSVIQNIVKFLPSQYIEYSYYYNSPNIQHTYNTYNQTNTHYYY